MSYLLYKVARSEGVGSNLIERTDTYIGEDGWTEIGQQPKPGSARESIKRVYDTKGGVYLLAVPNFRHLIDEYKKRGVIFFPPEYIRDLESLPHCLGWRK